MSCLAPRLVLLLLVAATAGTASAVPGHPAGALGASLRERIEAALTEPELHPSVIFERVESHATDGERELHVRIARGVQGPLREGFFVYLNRLQISLEHASVGVVYVATSGKRAAASPLELLAGAFRDGLAGLFEASVPREHTLETLPDAVLERSIGQIVFAPLEARLVSGRRAVELRAASAVMASDAGGLELTGVTVTTPAGHRLEAEEAVLHPGGLLFVMGGYTHTTATRERGDSATFAMTADGRGLVNRGSIPVGALVSADAGAGLAAFASLADVNPAFHGMLVTKTAKRAHRRS